MDYKFILSKRKSDIKNEYKDNRRYLVFSCIHRRKDETKKKREREFL